MGRKIFFLAGLSFAFLAWGEKSLAAPSVSGVSGTVSHGQNITVSGSAFGTKSPALPLWWDDGEGASNGQLVSRTAEIPHVVSTLSGNNKHYNDYWPLQLSGADAVDNMGYRDFTDTSYRNSLLPLYQYPAAPHSHSAKYLVGCHNDYGEYLGGEPAQTVALNVADIANKVPKDTWYVSYYYKMSSDWPDYGDGNNYKEVNWEDETAAPNYHVYDNTGNYDNVNACAGGTGGMRRSPPCKDSWIAVDNVNILTTLDGGTYGGENNASVLSDGTKNWPADYWVGAHIWNRTDGSKCLVVANNATTVTCTLSGGAENDWDAGDSYAFSSSGTSMPGVNGSSWSNCLDLQYQGGPVVTYNTGVKNTINQWVHYERMQSYSNSSYKKLSDNVVELDTALKPGCHLDLYHSHIGAVTIGGYYSHMSGAMCNGILVEGINTSNFNTVCVPLFDVWQANYNYAVGDKVRANPANNHVYRVTADNGLSGSSEPTWPASGTIADGQLTWTTESFGSYSQTGLDNGACRYFDDLYVDNTYSRIVLTDNATYESSTIVEPQIPSAWSDGSLTAEVNLGKLPDTGTAYLFVFDSNNEHNAQGYPITLGGGGGDITPPANPTGLSVN